MHRRRRRPTARSSTRRSAAAGLAAFDFNGKLAWHKDLGDVDNYHGAAGSPLLYKNRVILYQDFDGGSFVAAFDSRTGKEMWRTPRRASVGWGTPVAVRVGTRDEIIVSSQAAVTAYDPDTGRELWVCDGNSFEVIPTPVVGHGLVFASSGRVGPTLAIRPGGRGNVTRTHLAWTSPKGSPFVPSPIIYGDQLYMVNDMASIVTSFEAATGKVLWQGRLGVAQREGFSASPVAVDGKVFFTNDQGETFVLTRRPDVRAAAARTESANPRSRRPRSWTAAGTSGPIAASSPSENNCRDCRTSVLPRRKSNCVLTAKAQSRTRVIPKACPPCE